VRLYAIPIAIGLLAFYLVTGFTPFDWQNILWLGKGEPLTPYLGWEIFRNSPWESPLGLNPRYGLEEISSAVVFSDSIPILAIIFKIIGPILPSTFQYFGLWLLASFFLQALFAYKIMGLITKSTYIKSCAAILVLFLPPMLYRINVHISLAGHFFILWAIYLNLKKENRPISWALLIFISLGSQFYLFVMVMGLWAANLFDKIKASRPQYLIFNIGLILTVITIGGWQFGYFVIPSGISAGQGYGIYQANVLSFINPVEWSLFIKNNFYTPRNHEGNNYLGLGVIGLIFLSTLTLLKRNTRYTLYAKLKQHFFLAITLIALSLFAITNSIDIGKYNLFIPINEAVVSLLSTLRASGRMLWPLLYAAIFTSLWLLYISATRKVFLTLITVLTLVQVVDTSKGWLGLRDYFVEFQGNEIPTSLKNDFWTELPKKYSIIRLVPPQNWYHRWADIATYSAKNNIATSLVYLSRSDERKLKHAKEEIEEILVSGQFDSSTIYIFQKWTDNLDQPDPAFDPSKDLFAKIDGVTFFAPGFKACKICKQVDTSYEITSLIPEVHLGEMIAFSKGGKGIELLLGGWAWPESWGIWSEGASSRLAIPLGNGQAKKIQLNFRALLGPNHPVTRIEIYINGKYQKTIEVIKQIDNSVIIPIPEQWQEQKFITFEFRYLDPTSPSKTGHGNQDDRLLTIGLESLILLK
jgi:hypothetical protein